ncbi:hypothetical protein TOT_020000783 [Theileria orientalis strain Shintoku]|uniref:Uncharacterized protein n=1 Tax=Theileria orientalis strain Shintoku TaxID=869250 RepID=J4C8C1_THEOR|nr:hypothetical protein TOT_020000783 [Theileria orientalis strain Shintoku]BAM40528.1 hypothetical protein TOT_020000783 [Theileria orientalis strain Shintoku]|eukprot:XP_009690829.1 hypothetical protein TOT_020000783 [Theileria orientalis strain Shintoku]
MAKEATLSGAGTPRMERYGPLALNLNTNNHIFNQPIIELFLDCPDASPSPEKNV